MYVCSRACGHFLKRAGLCSLLQRTACTCATQNHCMPGTLQVAVALQATGTRWALTPPACLFTEAASLPAPPRCTAPACAPLQQPMPLVWAAPGGAC